MKLKHWAAFILLGLVWGSSFFWIKIALNDVSPLTLVAFRVFFGFVGVFVVSVLKGESLKVDGHWLKSCLFMSLFNTAVPFFLITWGETRIDSSMASILNGTVPLFTIVVAHFWLHDEKITFNRTMGLVMGFIGVTILVSRGASKGSSTHAGFENVIGQLAVLLASIFYAISTTFAKKDMKRMSPLVQATYMLLMADAFLWLAVLGFDRDFHLPTLPVTWFALLWLGFFGSCLAYILYFYLIRAWGSTRTSMVTYLMPVVGLILGIAFLNESIDFKMVLGTLLVVGGIVVVNLRVKAKSSQALKA